MHQSKLVAVAKPELNTAMVGEFLVTADSIIQAGQGGTTQYIKSLGISNTPLIKLLFNVEDHEDGLKSFVESVFCLIEGQPIRRTPELWGSSCVWRPVNPNYEERPYSRLVFDLEFALSIYNKKRHWELALGISGTHLDKIRSTGAPELAIIRSHIALLHLGLPEPEQFFRPNNVY